MILALGADARAQSVLTPVWTRMGDDDGVLDTDLDVPTSVENAEWSPDGRWIVSAAKGDGSVRLWDAATGAERWRVDPSGETEAVSFTRDGRFVVAGGEQNGVWVLALDDGALVRVLERDASVEGLRFSHDGARLATGDEAGRVTVWDTSAPDPSSWPTAPLFDLEHGPDQDHPADPAPPGVHADVNQVDWTADDRFLISGGRNGEVRLWDAADLAAPPVVIGRLPGSLKSARFSPDDRLVAASDNDNATRGSRAGVWDRATGRTVALLESPDIRVGETVAFSPDGRYLLVGGTQYDDVGDGRLYVFRVADFDGGGAVRPAEAIDVYNQEYLHFSPDGRRLVSSHQDGSLRVWDYAARATAAEPAPAPPALHATVLGNPSRGRTTLRVEGARGPVRVVVADARGRTVLTTEAPGGAVDLDLGARAAGLYLGRVSEGGRTASFHLFVAR